MSICAMQSACALTWSVPSKRILLIAPLFLRGGSVAKPYLDSGTHADSVGNRAENVANETPQTRQVCTPNLVKLFAPR